MIDLSPITDHGSDLVAGFQMSLQLSALAWLLACLIGIGLNILREGGPAPVRLMVAAYVDVMRGMPSLVLILACFYLLPATGLYLGPMASGLAALSLYYGAYMSEAMRGALAVIPAGQWEAATSTGLRPGTIMWRIILPQAIGPMIPSLTGLTIGLFKETALLSVISVPEFVFQAKEAISDSYAPFQIYAFVALVYWGASATIAFGAGRMERRFNRYRGAPGSALRA
jgi:polar amino acid transport system permease protein